MRQPSTVSYATLVSRWLIHRSNFSLCAAPYESPRHCRNLSPSSRTRATRRSSATSSTPAQPVIEHAAFVVAHGGQNTLASGLYYGVPSIHFPGDAVERQYNAEQLERCGAGISLPLAALRPRRLQRALEELLSGPYMRNA